MYNLAEVHAAHVNICASCTHIHVTVSIQNYAIKLKVLYTICRYGCMKINAFGFINIKALKSTNWFKEGQLHT